MWIYENQNWPSFSWDSKRLSSLLTDIRYRQGLLFGRMEALGFDLKNDTRLNTLTLDVVKSSKIEGENLDQNEVRSSIARKLGIESAGLISSSRDVDGVVEMILDATQYYSQPLTKKRLLKWHRSLFPSGRSGKHCIVVGDWRSIENDPMQVVSGHIGKETVHFEAPSAAIIESEIFQFLSWFNTETQIDPVLKAGIAHLWFITIHPFEDGNGRIARAIADMLLARAEHSKGRFYSLSAQIELDRKEYYLELERQQRNSTDITFWLEWFLNCLSSAISTAESNVNLILYKAMLWNRINAEPVHDRQKLIINKMLDSSFKGHINTSKYAKIVKCSNDTALRDIQSLKERNILIQNPGGGRSTSYRLVTLEEFKRDVDI